MSERVDLFGRTEAQLVAEIAHRKRLIAIAEVYRGNEGLALKLEMMHANLCVDVRCLARLRGQPVKYPDGEEPLSDLYGDALERWRANLEYLDRGYKQRLAQRAAKERAA